MSVEAQSMQNGFLYSRSSQGSQFLVKELVEEKITKSTRIPESLIFRDPS